MRKLLSTLLLFAILSTAHAQTQSWQWVKAGGSSSDNNSVQPAECKIAGCDAKGNVYAVGGVNGANMRLDTFRSAGSYSATGAGMSYLLFSYNCAGHMRWAKQIGDEWGNRAYVLGSITDPQGNTYLAGVFKYGPNITLHIGDSLLNPAPPMLDQGYICLLKFDSLGKLKWLKNYETDTIYHSRYNAPYGLRIGSSGNLWMACFLDSNYVISPNLHTSKKGGYNVELDPVTGNILSSYYTSNLKAGLLNSDDFDTYYDLDANENFYQTGTISVIGSDTVILANRIITADTHQTPVKSYIFSLDKRGNFRFVFGNKNSSATLGACKYDYHSNSIVTCWGLDTAVIYGSDTFRFNSSNLGNSPSSFGLLTIDTGARILWGKYITKTSNAYSFLFNHAPLAFYTDHTLTNGLYIYNNTDTIFNTTGSTLDFSKIVTRINSNGNLIATHTANEGALGNLSGSNSIKYGARDWRGNVYLGGTVSNYFATPADSVVNTDLASGNFFIAKLGISDCSCPTPGAQFTQTSHGDTAHYFGSSINHRDSIHWRFGDGSTSNKDSITHIYAHGGTYTVTAIAYNGCGIDSITKQITVYPLGITAIEPNKTNAYPNPVKTSINLEISAPALIGLVYANGATVWENPVQVNQQGTYVFDMSRYTSALYYFIVEYPTGKIDVMPVVKE